MSSIPDQTPSFVGDGRGRRPRRGRCLQRPLPRWSDRCANGRCASTRAPSSSYREPVSPYFAVKEGVPTILVETRRAWDLALEHRTVVHYAAILAAARYMAGYELTTPPRVIAEWLEPSANTAYRTAVAKRSGSGDDGKIAEAIANRQKAQLASRKGKPASVDKKRAELIKKRAAQQKKKTPAKKK